jgi:hypoxanthine phosphoribosyltransferase
MADENMGKIFESWEGVNQKSLQLAKMIDDSCKNNNERFDYIVVVPRGAYFPANIIARELGFGVKNLLHACIGSYDSGVANKKEELEIGDLPPRELVKDKALLIIDEVCDTGTTLKYLNDYFKELDALLVRSAVIHYKPINSQVDYKPDWFVEETASWIVYPWEINEDKQHLLNVMRNI